MDDTKIEWADDTVNPWWGCTRVSPACTNCYAEGLDARLHPAATPREEPARASHWGPGAPRKLRVEAAIRDLERIARRSDKEGRPRRVFIASMSDFFENRLDLVEPRLRVWEALHRIGPRITPLLLTKRPDVMAAWAEEQGWPDNAWAGTTVEDQRRADERIPHLLRVPARVNFLSVEPLLEGVDLRPWLGEIGETGAWTGFGDRVDWVIVGGESGPGARPMHPGWARSLRDQCQAADVAFFFKQWGEWIPNDQTPEKQWGAGGARPSEARSIGDGLHALRIGKKAAGRLLDGRTWDEVPHG